MAEFDLVVRHGEIVDGSGGAVRRGDIAVKDGRICRVGRVEGTGHDEIDARDKIVTPGFVDIHTHYDGQAIWDDTTAPSAYHGVTTAVMGNCGIGFAPCRPEDRQGLIDLMEGVEDIPGSVMHDGLTWEWESFPEYLDALDARPRDIDLCALVPHAPVRVFVMGERALRLEPATAADVVHMRRIVGDAIRAGGFGVSTSRTMAHQTLRGNPTPPLLAREHEIAGLVGGMADAGRGVFEFVTEFHDPDVFGEFEMVRRALHRWGMSGVFSMLQTGQTDSDTIDLWRDMLRYSHDIRADGVSLRPVVAPRAVGLLMGLEGSQNPFSGTPTYAEMAHRPLAERVARMRDPEIRRRILSEDPFERSTWPLLKRIAYARMYRFENPPNYVPRAADSLQALADRQGRPVEEVVYDVLLEDDGMGFIHVPFSNYASGDLRVCEEMLADPYTIMGLGDGGAHVGFMLDAGFQTWMLTHWVKQRGVVELTDAVRRMTSDTAAVMGLTDRGRIAPGLRADLNVIDLDALDFGSPHVVHDLPNGGKRLMQEAVGYDVTIVAGQPTYRNGVDCGARPGRLVRSGNLAPAGV